MQQLKTAASWAFWFLVFSFLYLTVVNHFQGEKTPGVSEATVAVDSTAWLWLARAVYSESKRPREQYFIAWMIRNRVETGYRGNYTYRATVLDPYQYSAFNDYAIGSENWQQKQVLLHQPLVDTLKYSAWDQAAGIAWLVLTAPDSARPFPIDTRHFFALRSMDGRKPPDWVDYRLRGTSETVRHERVELAGIDSRRLQAYRGVF